MTVLGRGLVFQPVLVTQTSTYNSNNIITLQNIDITDIPSKKERERETDRQTDRQADRQRQRKREREREWQADRPRERQTVGRRERHRQTRS